MRQHPFDVPEILEDVSIYLSQKDRIQCLRVSKNFYSVFISILWRRIRLRPPHPGKRPRPLIPSRRTLERHKHLIRDLVFEEIFPPEYTTLQDCRHLKVLRFSVKADLYWASFKSPLSEANQVLARISTLIRSHSSTLEDVSIRLMFWEDLDAFKDLLEALTECVRLKTLDLSDLTVPEEVMPVLRHICAVQLRSLQLSSVWMPDWFVEIPNNGDINSSNSSSSIGRDDGTYINNISYGNTTGDINNNQYSKSISQSITNEPYLHNSNDEVLFKALRHLTLYFGRRVNHKSISVRHQARIVRRFPNLESLSWPGLPIWAIKWQVPSASTPQTIGSHTIGFLDELAQDPWPFRYLDSLDLPWTGLNDDDLARTLRQLNRLRVLRVIGSQFGRLSLHELLIDKMILSGGRGQRDIPLCNTLETLDLGACRDVSSDMAQMLLSHCPNLRHFTADRISINDIAEGIEGHGEGWVCNGLRELEIHVDLYGTNSRISSDMMSFWQHAAYTQLGRLTELRILNLTFASKAPPGGVINRTLDLRLKAGLNILSKLKCLEELSFLHDPLQRMGVDEAIWMIEQWPKLHSLVGRLSDDKKLRRRVKAMLSSRHIITTS
ncbi:hypothetical protein BGZ99_008326 [Dissophora globulifera]|uniref:F-box domain-containing protein n=1 Tax=Dissophora globulifera TaxID=979702 RepID=A0A9P6UZD1_9FUNG|nr:hypothetical protein BGZ99_008326 [Dissophora globulifera]